MAISNIFLTLTCHQNPNKGLSDYKSQRSIMKVQILKRELYVPHPSLLRMAVSVRTTVGFPEIF